MKRLVSFFVLLFLISQSLFSQINFVENAAALGVGVSTGDTYLGNGISFYDYNNDGWDDITLPTDAGSDVRFFKNVNGTFVEEFLNIPSTNFEQKQINWVDFDNDGDNDLFVTGEDDGNKLYENDGSFNFTDITVTAGFPNYATKTYGASWGDFNNDGFLDVFLSTRDGTYTYANMLFQNNGNGTFTDVSVVAGVSVSTLSFCSVFFDYDNDGWQDLYIANDKPYTSNLLYRNNGNGTFTDVSAASGTNIFMDAMSTTLGDFNNDGWFDLYIANSPVGNVLYKNNADGTFTDIAASSGTLTNSFCWSAVFLDAENDMDLDLYVSSSYDSDNAPFLPSAFFENNNNETFNMPSGVGFVGDDGESYSNAIGDIHNDGLPDLVVSNIDNESVYLFENLTTTTNNWLKVNLEGTTSNRDGVGSVIEISTSGNKQFRYTLNGEGYLGQNSKTQFFGLGSNTTIDYVKVTWLSGIVDIHYNISANQSIGITEGSDTLSSEQNSYVKTRVFPNPVKDVLNINSTQQLLSYDIFDILGKNLMTKSVYSNYVEIDLSNLPSGIYILRYLTEDKQVVKKIFKE